MGWATGSEIAEVTWSKINKWLPEEKKGEVALEIVELYESYDCDTMYDCSFVEDLLTYSEATEQWSIK